MEVIKSKSVAKAIILLKFYPEDNSLLVVDNETTIRFLDNDTLFVQDGFKAGIKHQNYRSNVVAYSQDKYYFATTSADICY